MHEFSLAMEVVQLAEKEAVKNNAQVIKEIEIEVGYLSGVEADAFKSALELLQKDSMLSDAKIHMLQTPGKAYCGSCQTEFEMKQRTDSCPQCTIFPSKITGGEEFRVLSILI